MHRNQGFQFNHEEFMKKTNPSSHNFLRPMIYFRESIQVYALGVFVGLGVAFAFFSGADASFDNLNYHLYNGWATFRDGSSSFLPTSTWTYFPSHLDFIYYQIWAILPTIAISIIFGGFQGLIGYFVYEIVQQFESNQSSKKLSYRGIFFGILAMSSPLLRAQYGNNMHDLTLCVLEFFIVKKLVLLNLDNSKSTLRALAVLLGLTLALKPAHLIFVLVIGVFLILKPNLIEKTLLFGIAVTSFLMFSLPWIIRSFVDTKSLFFPFLMSERSGFLSVSPIVHSYEDWKIRNLSDFLLRAVFPGGNSRINHEINFMDTTAPVVVLLFIGIFLAKFANFKFSQHDKTLSKAGVFFSLGITIYMLNQLIFTGVRYVMIVFPLMVTALALCSLVKAPKLQIASSIGVLIVVFTNFLLPDSVYLPTRLDSIPITSVPDYGRTNHTFFSPQREGFTPPYEIDKKDLLILGQEQISFVAPLWNTDANIMGLQAYILGENAKRRMQSMINETIQEGREAYLVTLRQNVSTMENQLKSVDIRLGISECIPVLNPFRRDVVICMVKERVTF